MERELAASGSKEDLSKLSYDELTARTTTPPKPEPTPVAKKVVERTIINPEEAKVIIEDTRRRFGIMIRYYDPEETTKTADSNSLIPERVQEFLRSRVFFASSAEEAQVVAKSALDKLHMHILRLWGSKKIAGPNTPTNIRVRADKMEKWAKKLEERGRKEEAAQQHAKAEAVRRIAPTPPGSPWLV
jgi:hypothetical protein